MAFLPTASAADLLPDPGSNAANWRHFKITTRVTLPAAPGGAQLWLPLAQTAGGYQAALDLRWNGTGHTERVHDTRYGAPILRTTWDDKDAAPRQLEAVQTVAAHDRAATPLLPLTEAEQRFWTAPTASTPVDGIVRDTAGRITAGKTTRANGCERFTTGSWTTPTATPIRPAAARGDIPAMSATRPPRRQMRRHQRPDGRLWPAPPVSRRATCTASASPIHALFPCLGRSGDVSKAQHCRRGDFPQRRRLVPARSRRRAQGRAGTENSRSTARRCAPCATACLDRGK